MLRIQIVLICLLTLVCTGCFESSDCETSNTNNVRVQFLTKDSLLVDPVAFVVRAETNDSILYDGSTEISSYSLPLDPDSESVVYLFDDERVEFVYRKRSYLDGLNCEAEVSYDQLGVTSFTFDSVAVIQPLLDLEVSTNVEIYR